MADDETTASIIEPARPPASAARRAVIRWGRLCCMVAALAIACSEIAGAYWPFVLVTPYTPQWAAIAMIGVLLLAMAAARRKMDIDRVCLALGLTGFVYGGAITYGRVPWRTMPLALPVTITDADFGHVKILSANLHSSNKDHQTVFDLIKAEQPDIILLMEVNDAWMRDLRSLNNAYPSHRSVPDGTGDFGISVWSRLPIVNAEFSLMKDPQPAALVDVPQFDGSFKFTDAGGRERAIRFIGLHPMTPLKPEKVRARDAVLGRTAAAVAARPDLPTIVAGDFNATRYCHVMQPLATEAKLKDVTSPLRFSWPNTWSWWAMGIRIDHVLATDAWRVVDVHAGRDIHSDHLPIVATLQLVE